MSEEKYSRTLKACFMCGNITYMGDPYECRKCGNETYKQVPLDINIPKEYWNILKICDKCDNMAWIGEIMCKYCGDSGFWRPLSFNEYMKKKTSTHKNSWVLDAFKYFTPNWSKRGERKKDNEKMHVKKYFIRIGRWFGDTWDDLADWFEDRWTATRNWVEYDLKSFFTETIPNKIEKSLKKRNLYRKKDFNIIPDDEENDSIERVLNHLYKRNYMHKTECILYKKIRGINIYRKYSNTKDIPTKNDFE